MIRGAYLPASIDDLKLGQDKRPPMPFSDARLLGLLSHTLWFLPNVASCFAMANLLKQRQNRFYHDYNVIVCAGTGAGIGLDALYPVQVSMGNPLKTKTITLTWETYYGRYRKTVDRNIHATQSEKSGNLFPGSIQSAKSMGSQK